MINHISRKDRDVLIVAGLVLCVKLHLQEKRNVLLWGPWHRKLAGDKCDPLRC